MTSPIEIAVEHRPVPTIVSIQRATAEHFGISLDRLICRRRNAELVRPRWIAIWIARKLTAHSIPAIGREFKRDHTTIMYALQQMELLRKSKSLSRAISKITDKINKYDDADFAAGLLE